jgi:hypothetical protein
MRTEAEVIELTRKIGQVLELTALCPESVKVRIHHDDIDHQKYKNWQKEFAEQQPAAFELYRLGVLNGRLQCALWMLGRDTLDGLDYLSSRDG